MPNSWLDPLFLEMCYDKWLRGTPLVWPGFWQSLLWLMLGGLASLLLIRRPAHAHRILLLAGLAALASPLLSLVVERMNWGLFRQPALEPPALLFTPAEPIVTGSDGGFVAILRQRRLRPRVGRAWSLMTAVATSTFVVLIAFAQASTEVPNIAVNSGPLTVTGQVLDSQNRPIADAPVIVMTSPWRYISQATLLTKTGYEVLGQTRTDSRGAFRLTFSELARDCPGQYALNSDTPLHVHVVASAAGSGLGWQSVDVRSRKTAGTQPNVIVHLPPEQPLDGRVVDLQAQPAARVRLEVIRVGERPTFWVPRVGPNALDAIELFAERKPGRGGNVSDMDFNRPNLIAFWEPPAELAVWPSPVWTDADGRFTLRGVGSGQSIDLLVRDERFGYQLLSVEARRGPSQMVTLPLTAGRWIEGTVRDAESGQPISQAVVHADWLPIPRGFVRKEIDADWRGRGSSQREFFGQHRRFPQQGLTLPNPSARTDREGRFRINLFAEDNRFLPPRNTFVVWAHASSGRPYLDAAQVVSWASPDTARQVVDLSLQPGILVRGVVSDYRSGQPIAGSRVDFWSKNFRPVPGVVEPGPLETDRNGSFLVVLPAGRWRQLLRDWDRHNLGSQPRFYPNVWMALDVHASDRPQELRVTLRPKLAPAVAKFFALAP